MKIADKFKLSQRTSVTVAASIIMLGFVVLGVAACSSDGQDAVNAGTPVAPGANQIVIVMPTGYGTVGFICHGTTGVYVNDKVGYSGHDLSTVPNDPECV